MTAPADEALFLAEDEFELASAVWELIQQAGHLDCGGWTFDSRDTGVLCRCGQAVTAVPFYPDRRA